MRISDWSSDVCSSDLGSVGIAQSVVQMRVAGEDDATLPPGEAGEVLVRGDSVMKGYWRNPDATAETLRGGWLPDRKSVVEGKSGSVRVDPGGCGSLKKKKRRHETKNRSNTNKD